MRQRSAFFTALFFLASAFSAVSDGLSPAEKALVDRIEGERERAVALLKRAVDVPSERRQKSNVSQQPRPTERPTGAALLREVGSGTQRPTPYSYAWSMPLRTPTVPTQGSFGLSGLAGCAWGTGSRHFSPRSSALPNHAERQTMNFCSSPPGPRSGSVTAPPLVQAVSSPAASMRAPMEAVVRHVIGGYFLEAVFGLQIGRRTVLA